MNKFFVLLRVFLVALGKWASFVYLLRFAILLWLFAPVLCLLNIFSATLTSGILVCEAWEQYLCVSFFLICAACSALVLARIALIYGPERLDLITTPDDCRPLALKNLLVNDDGKREFLALLFSQLPNVFVYGYLIYFGRDQGVAVKQIVLGLVVGVLLACIFWWNANAWYYLTYKALSGTPLKFVLGQNAARTILFPRVLFGLNPPHQQCPGKVTIEQAHTIFSRPIFGKLHKFSGLGLFVGLPGYEKNPNATSLYEAHNFAIISLVIFGGLYLLLWPLTAPVGAPVASWIAIAALGAFIAFVLFVFWSAQPISSDGKVVHLRKIQIWNTVTIVVFFLTILFLYLFTQIERFPIFATVLILITAVSWMLGALAFFFDRYRVPVLTLLLVSLVVPRMFHLDRTLYVDSSGVHAGNGQEEHYLSITSAKSDAEAELPEPSTILQQRLAADVDDKPLIIVTATGGGLHASAWTAAVLAHLEQTFGPDFHNHLLLASTVSGGSVGLMSYLRELHDGTLDSRERLATLRMQSVAQCSSLEGVGWGLVYYDLPKAFIPILPWFVSPSSGDGDLDTNGAGRTPLGKDRTWSLRKSFLRNLDDTYCRHVWQSDTNSQARWKSHQDTNRVHSKSTDLTGSGLTLRDFPAGSSPAFTMNTTVVESGERFLSANYKIPDCKLEGDSRPDYRARSFLETFKRRTVDQEDSGLADLPIASAAQLSATFPYVSSAARAPMAVDNAVNSVHFADGGYYDNDGTSSAIEFLRYALGPANSNPPSGTAPEPAKAATGCPSSPAVQNKPLRILLIEIRNSNGIYGSGAESEPDHNGGTAPWNLFSQVGGPLLGFWQAGHESITPRDQSGLELLEHAYAGKLIIQSLVFADQWSNDSVGTDPLNWSLTPRQRKEVHASAKRSEMTSLYQLAQKWFNASPAAWSHAPARDGGPQENSAK
ncbi:MAG: hypothetical protein JST28_11825 [Acidobacteria bacterium]|nr:hypothetical protein [Acidobacteriota bacterium]